MTRDPPAHQVQPRRSVPRFGFYADMSVDDLGVPSMSVANPSVPVPTFGGKAESVIETQNQKEEAEYLHRRNTRERPPAHMIQRQRRAIDWKSLRYQGSKRDAVEVLLRKTTKDLKSPTDAPRRPMNGESNTSPA